MLKISITNANDENRVGEYLFHKNLIYIGSNHDADIYAPLEKVEKNHIFLEVVDEALLVHPGRGIEYILVNTKRTVSFKKLKKGDQVQVGDLVFKIDDYQLIQNLSVKEHLKQKVETIKKDNPNQLKVLKSLSDAL